jgi:hypothetical protein
MVFDDSCYINKIKMRNHFAQRLPFPKKDNEFKHNISDQLHKTIISQSD